MTTFTQVNKAQKSIESANERVNQILEGSEFEFSAKEFDNEFVYFQVYGNKLTASKILDLKEKTRFTLVEEQYLGEYYFAIYKQNI